MGGSGFRRIVLPVKEDTRADRLLTLASTLAAGRARVTLVHVIEVPSELPLDAHFHEEERRARELLESARAALEHYELRVETRVLRDRAASGAILRTVQEVGADLVVIGAARRLAARRLRLGSTAEAVLRACPCRVMLAADAA